MLVLLAAGLSGLAFAFFRWRAGSGLEPVLQEQAAADPNWLTHPTSAFQSPQTLQRAAAAALSRVLVALLFCGVAVAAVAFLTLVLTHFSAKRSEFATRAALGATPGRSTREIAAPLLRVGAVGAVGAAALGAALFLLAQSAWPGQLIGSAVSRVLWGLLAVLLCAAGCVAFSVGAVRLLVVRTAVAGLLRGGSRTIGSLLETRIRELLVVLQTAACVVVVAVAGVLMQGRPAVASGKPTLRTLQVIRATAESARNLSTADRVALLESVLQKARALPQVRAESLASAGSAVGLGLFDRLYSDCDVCRFGAAVLPYTLITLRMHAVTPNYFELTGARLLSGRSFTYGDRLGAPPVVVVNEAFAHAVFGPGSPLGRKVRLRNGFGETHVIVGMIENDLGAALGAPGRKAPQVYFAALQHPPTRFDLILSGPEAPAFTHPQLTVASPLPLSDLQLRAGLPTRVAARSALLLALLCGLIAVYGLYSTTQGFVSGRAHELSVRLAVGCTPGVLVRYAAMQTMRLALIGTALGFAAAYAAQQVLALILPGAHLTPGLVAGAGGLVCLALLASVAQPAWTAARVHPALSLSR